MRGLLNKTGTRNIVVGIEIRYRLEGPGSKSWNRQEVFSTPQPLRQVLGPTQPAVQ